MSADPSGTSSRERFLGLLWLVAAAIFMQVLDSTVVNTAAPAIADALGGDSAGHAHGTDQLHADPGDPDDGRPPSCDRLGARRVLGIAIALFGLGSLLCGLAQTLPQLAAARVLQGIGGASPMPVGR